jgi:hypothetical protein
MQSFLIFISFAVFTIGGYIVWPSRYNVMTHLNVGFVLIAFFIPAVILQYQDYYPARLVSFFTDILVIGAICYTVGLCSGFYFCKPKQTQLSFDVMDVMAYEKRVIRITRILLYVCIISLVVSYLVMGFVPMFAADPLSAKFFRGAYREPYLRVAVLYRFSFYILSTIIPIAAVVWYQYRKPFFLYAIGIAIALMLVSLSRGPAFTGLLTALAIVLSVKSRFHFKMLLVVIISSYFLSAFFYAIAGIVTSNGDVKTEFLVTIAGSAPDMTDALEFLGHFEANPKWTYGRNVYGSFIPGHYEWNPAVYTLQVVADGADVDDIVSGGLRVPLPFWGYVSFGWIGIAIFTTFTGVLNGIFLKYTKYWMAKHTSLIVRTVVVVINITIFSNIAGFYGTAFYFALPPMFILAFYMYRFKFKVR